MVREDDYNDATEASNITSLQSDLSARDLSLRQSLIECTRAGESKVHLEYQRMCHTIAGNMFYETLVKDCKCCQVHPYMKRDACRTATEQVQQKESPDPQSPLKEFETSVPCICYAHRIPYTLPVQYVKDKSRAKHFLCGFKWKWPRRNHLVRKDKTYEVKIKPNQCPHYTKPFMCCEISEGIPKPKIESKKNEHHAKEGGSPKSKKKGQESRDVMEKIDIYYFDHGNSAYYRTTDSPPILVTEKCAEKIDQAATRFWAEIFGTVHIGTAFVTAFILQLLRFVLYSLVRPLSIGIPQLFADYFLKPLLSMLFNALIQPFLILLYNIATSLKDLCQPIAEATGFFLREIANLFAAIRFVEIKQCGHSTTCT